MQFFQWKFFPELIISPSHAKFLSFPLSVEAVWLLLNCVSTHWCNDLMHIAFFLWTTLTNGTKSIDILKELVMYWTIDYGGTKIIVKWYSVASFIMIFLWRHNCLLCMVVDCGEYVQAAVLYYNSYLLASYIPCWR